MPGPILPASNAGHACRFPCKRLRKKYCRAMITEDVRSHWPKLRQFPIPAKVLVTAILGSMAIGLVGALGQILIHDIIPTFYKGSPAGHAAHSAHEPPGGERGDLLADMPSKSPPEIPKPIYESEQFVWTLRWTHIHLFGMNMIFIFVGMVTSFLDLSSKTRSLVDRSALYRHPDRHRKHVAEGLCISAFFLAARSGWRTLRNDICFRVRSGVLRDVGTKGRKRRQTAMNGSCHSGESKWIETHYVGRIFSVLLLAGCAGDPVRVQLPPVHPADHRAHEPEFWTIPNPFAGSPEVSFYTKVLRASPLGPSLKASFTPPPRPPIHRRRSANAGRPKDCRGRRTASPEGAWAVTRKNIRFSLCNVDGNHPPDDGLRSGSEKGRIRPSPADGK